MFLLKLFKNLAILFIAGLIACYLLSATNAGTKLIYQITRMLLPGDLSIENMNGALLGPLEIENLNYIDHEKNRIRLQHFQIDWHGLPFFTKIIINTLAVRNLDYIVGQSPKEVQPPTSIKEKEKSFVANIKTFQQSLKEILQYIAIKQFQLNDIRIIQKNKILIDVNELKLTEGQDGFFVFNLKSSFGHINGRAQLNFDDNPKWEFKLDANQFNPGAFYYPLNGNLHFTLASNGNLNLQSLKQSQMQVHMDELSGTLAKENVHGHLDFTAEHGEIIIKRGVIEIGHALANIVGHVKDSWDMHWELHIPELKEYVPSIQGQFFSEGIIVGKLSSPTIQGNLTADKITITDIIIPNLNFNFSALINPELIDFNLSHGKISYPLLGVQVDQLNATGKYQFNDNKLTVLSTLSTITKNKNHHKGLATLKGTFQFGPQLDAAVALQGDQLMLMHTHDYELQASTDLNYRYSSKGDNHLSGKVIIPFAKITPADLSETVSLPDDVIIVKNDKKSAIGKDGATPPAVASQTTVTQTPSTHPFTMDVAIQLGDHVLIDYAHLSSHLRGHLTITQAANGAMLGTGDIQTVNGKYQAYGKSLTIDEGRLLFKGNVITNPGLAIRASTTIKEMKTHAANDVNTIRDAQKLKVGVNVTGTVLQPHINLFSDPTGLSQNDILSYLLFGYPQAQIADTNSTALINHLLANMVTMGSGNKSSQVTDKFKNMFGLAEFNVGMMDYMDANQNIENATVVSIGKKIGKRLFVQYTTGVFQPISILSLKYQINKRLALKSETSSVESGADLIYEIEKD